MTTSPDDSAAFRRHSTRLYRAFVVVLSVLALGCVALGWWIGRWWGLIGGTAVGAVVLIGGLVAGTLMWAMTQDGG